MHFRSTTLRQFEHKIFGGFKIIRVTLLIEFVKKTDNESSATGPANETAGSSSGRCPKAKYTPGTAGTIQIENAIDYLLHAHFSRTTAGLGWGESKVL